ncbi:ArsR/SmtB family transcription factor [Allokutzneria oryzae]|uniref:ArsR/SmtB family transcription factor n=1 Tax=Allokutzneria oryzae TaxID=1378989 RepID=A0ABV6A0Z6_9PSEU
MIRLHLSLESSQAVRFADGPLPVVELVGALCRFRRLHGWQPPHAVKPLFDLFSVRGQVPDFLLSRRPELGAALEELAAVPAERIRAELAFHGQPLAPWVRELGADDRAARTILLKAVETGFRSLVGARWNDIVATAQTDLAQRGRVLLHQGLAKAIASLPSTISHSGRFVDVDGSLDRGVPVANGLDFVPSCLMPVTLVIPARAREPVTVVYPVPPATPRIRPGRPSADSLSALVGARRAAILRATAVPRGTTELAEQAGVSLSSASEHASALRNAGLIRTVRAGRKVLHTATDLGSSLVTACDPP